MQQHLLAALLKTAGLTDHIQDEQGIVRGALLHLAEALGARCTAFYPAIGFPGANREPLRAGPATERELPLPSELPYTLELNLRNQPHHTANNLDPLFALGVLHEMPPGMSTCSSAWLLVGDANHPLGILALLDTPERVFREEEIEALRLFGQLAANMLLAITARRAEQQRPTPHSASARFAGGAELIDPLTAVLGYVELLKAEKLDARCRHFVAKLEQQAERAQKKLSEINSQMTGAHCPLPMAAAAEKVAKSVTEPIAFKPAPPKRPVAALSVPMPKARILLVQPNPAVLEFERSVFQALGAEVIALATADEAKPWIEGEELSALVLDYDGEHDAASRQLMAWVRDAKPRLAGRVLVTVSARAASELPADGTVTPLAKPLQVDALYLSAQRLLGLEALGSELVH